HLVQVFFLKTLSHPGRRVKAEYNFHSRRGKRTKMRRLLFNISLVFACSVLIDDSARAADIPSLGSGALPRVMIIFYNSLSMVLKPDDQFGDLTWQYDDYDPDNNPAGSCQNKFCIAKKVLSTTLPAYSSLTQMGLATYYQYLKNDLIPVGGGTTDCTYDVLA